MMPSISVADVSNLCENTLLREAEERIASAVGQSVVDPAPHATRALDAAVLERTGLSGQEILSVLESRMDLLVKFSVRLLKEESSFRDEQEFHPSEGKQDWERDASEPLGLCRGSSLLFACYLWYLDGEPGVDFGALGERGPGLGLDGGGVSFREVEADEEAAAGKGGDFEEVAASEEDGSHGSAPYSAIMAASAPPRIVTSFCSEDKDFFKTPSLPGGPIAPSIR